MKSLFIYLLLFAGSAFGQAESTSQIEEHDCILPEAETENEEAACTAQGPQFSENGFYFTPKGHLHIPIIVIDFLPHDPNWPRDFLVGGSLTNPFPILFEDQADVGTVNAQNLSNWFFEMSSTPGQTSGNEFIVTGEVIVVEISNPGSREHNFGQAILELNSNPIYTNPTSPQFVDWSSFDLRTNNPNFRCDNRFTQPDGIIDMAVMIDRNFGTNKNQASPGIFNYTFHDGTQMRGGFKTWGIKPDAPEWYYFELFRHEFYHVSMKAPHYNEANKVTNPHRTTNIGWGHMGRSSIFKTASAFDRDWAGWILPQEITQNTSNVKLNDFVTTGDALKIPIPNSPEGHVLWIENHQMINQWDEDVHFADPIHGNTQLTHGLYAYITTAGSDKHSVNDHTYYYPGNISKTLTKSGHYDYVWDGQPATHLANGLYSSFVMEQEKRNDISGLTSVAAIPFDHDDIYYTPPNFTLNGTITYSPGLNSNGGKPESEYIMEIKDASGQIKSYGFRGDPDIAFSSIGDGIGLNRNIPALEWPKFNNSTKEQGEYNLNNLDIVITYVNPTTGEIWLNIDFNQPDIWFAKEWSGRINLPDNPNIGTDLRITGSSGYLTLSRSQSALKFDNPVDFSYSTKLMLNPGSKMEVDGRVVRLLDDSKLRVQNTAELHVIVDEGLLLENTSKLVIEDGGKVVINDLARAVLHDNSELLIKSGGELVLNNSAYLDLRDNAILTVEDGAKLILNSGTEIKMNANSKIEYENNDPIKGIDFQGGSIDLLGDAQIIIRPGSIFEYPSTSSGSINLTDNGTDIYVWGQLTTEAGSDFVLSSGIGNLIFDGSGSQWIVNNLPLTIAGNIYHDRKVVVKNGAQIDISPSQFDLNKINIRVKGNNSKFTLNSNSCCSKIEHTLIEGVENALPVPFPETLVINTQNDFIFSNNEVKWVNGGIEINGNGSNNLVSDGVSLDFSLTEGIEIANFSDASLSAFEIENCDVGLIISNVGIASFADGKIHNNQTGIYGIFQASVSEGVNLEFSQSECVWVYNNGTGIKGENIMLGIDNSSSNHHRFDGNNIVFDLCYSGTAPPSIDAKNNYWGSGGYSPSSSNFYQNGCPTSIDVPNVVVNATPYLSCVPVNCSGCTAEEERIGKISSTIQEGLRAYPNPSDGVVHVSSPESIIKIQVYDLSGKMIEEHFPNSKSWDIDLPSGSYILKVIGAFKSYQEKVIVERN